MQAYNTWERGCTDWRTNGNAFIDEVLAGLDDDVPVGAPNANQPVRKCPTYLAEALRAVVQHARSLGWPQPSRFIVWTHSGSGWEFLFGWGPQCWPNFTIMLGDISIELVVPQGELWYEASDKRLHTRRPALLMGTALPDSAKNQLLEVMSSAPVPLLDLYDDCDCHPMPRDGPSAL